MHFIGNHTRNNVPPWPLLSFPVISLCPKSCRHRRLGILYKHSCPQEQASLKQKESSQWDTPPPIHPTPPPTQLGPQLPTKQLWPLVGCGCIGCCHGDRGTLLSHTYRSSTEWVSPAWETQRIHRRLLLMQPLMLLHTTSWISERAPFHLAFNPPQGQHRDFCTDWLGVEGNPLPLLLLQFLFKEAPASDRKRY